MVIVNHFTKIIRLKATTIIVLLEKIAKICWDNIWKMHGIPKKVFSDRGLQFALQFMEDLCNILEMKKKSC